MVDPDGTILTERQVEVLEHRERGLTQQEVADVIGTTDSNVSAVERAARENVEKARRTLELVRSLRAPAQFTVQEETYFDDVVDEVYARGDETGIKVAYSRPELYAHLYEVLEDHISENQLDRSVEVGLTKDGEVETYTNLP